MAETSTISRLANQAFVKIFKVFGWQQIGPCDQNWECVEEAHQESPRSLKSHPSDVVFFYEDPYRMQRIYWNVDLKSYASSSISSATVSTAMSSLAKAVACANKSSEWQGKYADDAENWRCDGLLFIYNHDNEYDKSFESLRAAVDRKSIPLPECRRIVVLGPPDIAYLSTVANDIMVLRGDGVVSGIRFWYPDLVRQKIVPQEVSAATIETLTGPWIVLKPSPCKDHPTSRLIVYYRCSDAPRRPDDLKDEFLYLLDSFFRFQMLTIDDNVKLEVRLVTPVHGAPAAFDKAKISLSYDHYGLMRERLDSVTCKSVEMAVFQFSQEQIGMEGR